MQARIRPSLASQNTSAGQKINGRTHNQSHHIPMTHTLIWKLFFYLSLTTVFLKGRDEKIFFFVSITTEMCRRIETIMLLSSVNHSEQQGLCLFCILFNFHFLPPRMFSVSTFNCGGLTNIKEKNRFQQQWCCCVHSCAFTTPSKFDTYSLLLLLFLYFQPSFPALFFLYLSFFFFCVFSVS